MVMWRLVIRFFFLLLVMSILIGLVTDVALAQPESIKLEATYVRIESATPREGFQFSVRLQYEGHRARTFDLRTSGPEGWTTYITPRISAITLQPDVDVSTWIRVTAYPPTDQATRPGEYKIILFCSSDTVGSSLELTAVVLPAYSISLTLFEEQWSYDIKAGQNNVLSMNVRNTGSTMISDIRFSLIKPEGWSVEFKPDEIDHLDVGSSRSFEFIIRPDEETASGRYLITVIAESDWMRTEREIRVNVKSFQMVWLWVGVAVVCVVIAGFVVVYMRFGRR